MPLLRINATASGLTLDRSPRTFEQILRSDTGRNGPAIIMVHGYKYAPGSKQHCPHQKIYAFKKHSWPTRLGFGQAHTSEGLGIALGWYARGALPRAHKSARALGVDIARLVTTLRRIRPDQPVHIIAHSLGAEAALSTLPYLASGSIDRMVLLTGASYQTHACAMLQTPAGRTAEVLNMTSRENDLFDAVFERLVRPDGIKDRAIGQGISAPNVATLQLDCAATLSGLQTLGFVIGAPHRRICHWSAYTRTGVMGFYNAFLRSPSALPLSALATHLPQEIAPRWSGLLLPPHRLRGALTNALPRPAHQISWRAVSDGLGLLRRTPYDTAC